MGTYTSNAGFFLINILLGSAIFIALLRLILQLMGADSRNPISQSIKAITDPILQPTRRYLPKFQSLDSASLLMLVAMQMMLTWLSLRMISTLDPSILSIFVFSIGEIIAKFVRILIWAIIINALISWFSAGSYHPIVDVINSITNPLLNRARKVLPMSTGLDFSPLMVIIVLQLVLILVVSPLKDISNIFL
ncbi:MAG: YggT family protein [Gammaproteobacteria bacterium]|jgi:YggT family protein